MYGTVPGSPRRYPTVRQNLLYRGPVY
jgi:hypothetical protein